MDDIKNVSTHGTTVSDYDAIKDVNGERMYIKE